jgi:DNA polymerase III sliding clamp (beta) subunit (PCNA family)
MKFKVRQNELINALKIIKNSKAFTRSDDENSSNLLIKANKESNQVEFIASNLEIWAGAFLNEKIFSKEEDIKSLFSVDGDGKVFVNIYEFIDVMYTYPPNFIIEFETIEKMGGKEKKSKLLYLEASCVKGKKKTKKTGFLFREPKIFEETPPEETRENIGNIKVKDLFDAVNSVEFASGADDREKFLWGVQVELYKDGINAVATDRNRVCYYMGKTEKEDGITLCPFKAGFYTALKNLLETEPVDFEIGQRRTIIRQKGIQWHSFPNIVFGEKENMPDWRSLLEKFSQEDRVSIEIPKRVIIQSIDTALSASGGKFGMKMEFDSEAEEIKFSVKKIEIGGVINSMYEETEELLKNKFSFKESDREIKDGIIVSIESLKEIVSRSKGENIIFKVLDNKSPILISNDGNTNLGYICGVITE